MSTATTNAYFPVSSSQKVSSIWRDDNSLLDEQAYFVSTNPTVGTAIAITTSIVDDAATASSTHAQFAPSLLIYNSAIVSPQSPNIYMRYVKLLTVGLPTSATAWKYSWRLDNVNRYSSGGTQITPVAVNPLTTTAPKALVYFGAIVPTALPSNAAKLLAAGTVRPVIPVAGDQYLFSFGAGLPADQQIDGTNARNITISVPPVVIPPGWCLALDLWGASNGAAASYEFEVGHVERVSGL